MVDVKKMPNTCPTCGGSGQASGSLGAKLQWLRKQAGINQNELADELDMKRPTIANIETGYQGATAETIVKLAKHFSVSSDWLLGINQ